MWNRPRLSLVLSTHAAQFSALTYQGDLEANIARIAGMGYDGVELAIRDPDLVDAVKLEAVLGRYKLRVPAIGTGQAWGEEHLSFTDPDPAVRCQAVRRIERQIQLARRLEALVIIGLLRGVTSQGITRQQSMEWLEACLGECVERATEQGVRLALEPLNRYETDLIPNVEAGLELMSHIDSPNFGLLLDTFHMNLEEPSIEGSIRAAGEAIFHFHVADSNRWHPGAGHLDFKSIFRALESTGYGEWISGEFMPLPDADQAAKGNIEYLRQVLEKD